MTDATTLTTALKGKDAWLCIDIAGNDLMAHVDVAVKNGLKRVVFGVNLSGSEAEMSDLVFNKETELLTNSGIQYTIVKYSSSNVSKIGESKVPYRIVRAGLPLPKGKTLSHEDLMRIFVEVVDLPKSFNNVYGVGPGTALDTEILVYMKSQGDSLTHSLIPSLIHSFTLSLIHSLTHSISQPFTLSVIHSLGHSLSQPFTNSHTHPKVGPRGSKLDY